MKIGVCDSSHYIDSLKCVLLIDRQYAYKINEFRTWPLAVTLCMIVNDSEYCIVITLQKRFHARQCSLWDAGSSVWCMLDSIGI